LRGAADLMAMDGVPPATWNWLTGAVKLEPLGALVDEDTPPEVLEELEALVAPASCKRKSELDPAGGGGGGMGGGEAAAQVRHVHGLHGGRVRRLLPLPRQAQVRRVEH